MEKDDLLKIIEDDNLGLLTIKPRNSFVATPEERLIDSFLEINNFVKENKREPQSNGDLNEYQLASRLKYLRENQNKSKILMNFDEYNLLKVKKKEIKTIRDILDDDNLGLLNTTEDDLFKYKNISRDKKINKARNIAHRKPCKDFEKYENIFTECQKGLSVGEKKLIKFTRDSQIKKKSFFVLNGILLLIEDIENKYINKYGRWDSKLRCIFENGTESNMLLRSLARGLYENKGYLVSEKKISEKMKKITTIDNKDVKTGFIYIVKSLSQNEKIKSLKNLYKIGFSNVPVEERIKNAPEDPTYLMAPVSIVSTFECYNFNPQKLEQLLHNFFGTACLNIDIFDAKNQRHLPREWFMAPLEVIEGAIKLIIEGGIVNYKYDTEREEITLK